MPPPDGDGSSLQPCKNCGALVDTSDQEPLAKFHCPLCGTAMRASRQFNHFSIVEALGSGGMGSVYKALDRNLNRMVALKLLRKELSADEKYILKLEDEARITASINHPYVVKVFSFGSDQGQYYIAMELVDKGSLDDLMRLQNRVAELQVMSVGLQVASGLQAAHERGLIHRDVKPGNILFADAHTAKITDFGLALLAEQEAESRGEIWGTPYYIAPEKLNNEPEDFRSDIYSLGGTLFHAVAGRPPFEAESASLVALKHLKSRAVSLQAFAPDVSSETAYVVNRMLHKDPNQRYPSYTELIDHMKYAIDTLNAKIGTPRSARQRVVIESESQSNIVGLLTLGVLVLLIIAGALAFIFRATIFGNPTPPGTVAVNPAAATADSSLGTNAVYEEARHQIVKEQYVTAQASFGTLLKNQDLAQPLRNWARLHLGMTDLLGHELEESRSVFARLQSGGRFAADDASRPLADFFVEAGRFLGSDSTIAASATHQWDRNTYEDIGLFLFGLKDWEMGDFVDAKALFDAYLAGKPAAPYSWMTDYQFIARKCVHDYALYAPLQDKSKSGTADSAALLSELTKARGQLQTTGKMVEALFTIESDLKAPPPPALAKPSAPPTPVAQLASPAASTATPAAPTATPAPSPRAAASTPGPTVASGATPAPANTNAEHAAETIRWQTSRETYEKTVSLYRFEAGLAVLQSVQVTSPEFVQARDITLIRAQRLVAFKRELVADINERGGYPQPITTRRNITFPRGIVSATADGFQGGTPYGVVLTSWIELTPETILIVARYFADTATEPRKIPERRMNAATFALETGRMRDARALATLAAQADPAYRKDLPQFTEGPAGHAPPPPLSSP